MKKRKDLLLTGIVALVVVLTVHFLNFPGSVPRFRQVSGGGELLDASPAFTVDGVYKRLLDYGEAGRDSYAFRNVTVDILLPLGVLPFLFLLMLRTVKELRISRALRAVLLSIPFVYVVLDLAENAVVVMLLKNYPHRMDTLATVLPYVTVVKRAASLLAILVPIAILGIAFVRKRVRRV